jgi:hypothetical protein
MTINSIVNKISIRKPLVLDSTQKGTTDDTDKNSKSEGELHLRKQKTIFKELSKKLREENYHKHAGEPIFTRDALERVHFAKYLSCFLAWFSIGIIVIEHEMFLKYGDDTHSNYRFVLLCIHLLTTILL